MMLYIFLFFLIQSPIMISTRSHIDTLSKDSSEFFLATYKANASFQLGTRRKVSEKSSYHTITRNYFLRRLIERQQFLSYFSRPKMRVDIWPISETVLTTLYTPSRRFSFPDSRAINRTYTVKLYLRYRFYCTSYRETSLSLYFA